jgi:hypothetical protein
MWIEDGFPCMKRMGIFGEVQATIYINIYIYIFPADGEDHQFVITRLPRPDVCPAMKVWGP